MNQQFYDAMEESPVIAAVKDFEGLEKCCRIEEIRVVFILFGDVCNTILRFFIIDSMAFENISKQCHLVKADFIEILPGVMPKIIKKICKMGNIPVIAGGLVMDKEDVMAALSAGAISVSTTNQDVWLM